MYSPCRPHKATDRTAMEYEAISFGIMAGGSIFIHYGQHVSYTSLDLLNQKIDLTLKATELN